ncbi:MAG: phosphate ABC transporter ATP-binding protein PstB [Bacillota bacterium]
MTTKTMSPLKIVPIAIKAAPVPPDAAPVADRPETSPEAEPAVLVRGLSVVYGTTTGVKGVDLDLPERSVTALIGPSGCGKSTFLRAINRMNELFPGVATAGEVRVRWDGLFQDIYAPGVDLVDLRKRIGMVFQRPNPFPKSIFENVVYGPRHHGVTNRALLAEAAEEALLQAALWDEVKDKLNAPAAALSGGQQQRLCIARALAVRPDVVLMDEPTASLDPISTGKIEDLLGKLSKDYTIVIVTHNLQQAARVSQKTAFFLNGELVEAAPTLQMMTNPRDRRTENYVTGRFG